MVKLRGGQELLPGCSLLGVHLALSVGGHELLQQRRVLHDLLLHRERLRAHRHAGHPDSRLSDAQNRGKRREEDEIAESRDLAPS